MAIVSYVHSGQIAPMSGYNYVAELQYGSDGQMYGPPELDAGTASNKITGNATWDGNPQDGIDSGWLTASYGLQAGTGGLTWDAGGSVGPLTYNVGTLTNISSIKIRAAVQNQAAMLWQDAVLKFYRGSTLQETVNLNSFGPDLTDSGGVAQDLVTIQPANTDNNRVEIVAGFRMIAPMGVYLDSYDAFSQIFSFSGRPRLNASGSGDSLIEEPIVNLDAQASSDGLLPASSPFSDDLLGVEQSPDVLQSADPAIL